MDEDRGEDAKVILDPEHPWPGLESFHEENSAYFFGREKEISELARIVRREKLTLFFGKSGLGKTSLLRAGLFPSLRVQDFVPIYIRLNHNEGTPPLADQIEERIEGTLRERVIDAPKPRRDQTLWEYFHRRDMDWWDDGNRLVKPVLVFDQFEEILTLGSESKFRRDRVDAFLTELEDLVENHIPEPVAHRVRQNPAAAAAFDKGKEDFRVVISLREDFLADLEGLRERLRPIMLNRFRLLLMNGSQACEVVLEPGRALLGGTDAEREDLTVRIVDFVSSSGRSQEGPATTRDDLATRGVEPALLSVFCSELNRRRIKNGQATITPELLTGSRTEILKDFYADQLKDMGDEVHRFIEEKLLTVSGARNRCAIEDALQEPGMTSAIVMTLIGRRILRKERSGDVDWIELTHDRIADVARPAREERRNRAKLEAERIKAAEARQRQEELAAKLEAARRGLVFAWSILAVILAGLLVIAVVLGILAFREYWKQVEQREWNTLLRRVERDVSKGRFDRARRVFDAALDVRPNEEMKPIAALLPQGGLDLQRLAATAEPLVDIAFSSDGSRLAGVSASGRAWVIDPAAEPVGSFVAVEPSGLAADEQIVGVESAVDSARSLVLFLTSAGRIVRWDCASGRPAGDPLNLADGTPAQAASATPVERKDFAVPAAKQVAIVQRSLSAKDDIVAAAKPVQAWKAFALSPDGSLLAAGRGDAQCAVYAVEGGAIHDADVRLTQRDTFVPEGVEGVASLGWLGFSSFRRLCVAGWHRLRETFLREYAFDDETGLRKAVSKLSAYGNAARETMAPGKPPVVTIDPLEDRLVRLNQTDDLAVEGNEVLASRLPDEALAVAFRPDGNAVAASTVKGVAIWQMARSPEPETAPAGPAQQFIPAEVGRYSVRPAESGRHEASLVRWDESGPVAVASLPLKSDEVRLPMTVTREGAIIAAIPLANSTALRVEQIFPEQKTICEISAKTGSRIERAAISRGGRFVALVTSGAELHLLESKSGTTLRIWKNVLGEGEAGALLTVQDDGRWVALAVPQAGELRLFHNRNIDNSSLEISLEGDRQIKYFEPFGRDFLLVFDNADRLNLLDVRDEDVIFRRGLSAGEQKTSPADIASRIHAELQRHPAISERLASVGLAINKKLRTTPLGKDEWYRSIPQGKVPPVDSANVALSQFLVRWRPVADAKSHPSPHTLLAELRALISPVVLMNLEFANFLQRPPDGGDARAIESPAPKEVPHFLAATVREEFTGRFPENARALTQLAGDYASMARAKYTDDLAMLRKSEEAAKAIAAARRATKTGSADLDELGKLLGIEITGAPDFPTDLLSGRLLYDRAKGTLSERPTPEQFETALGLLSTAAWSRDRDRGSGLVVWEQSWVLEQLGRTDEAIDGYLYAAESLPGLSADQRAILYRNVAINVRDRDGFKYPRDRASAEQYLKIALSLNPAYSDAYVDLAALRWDRGDREAAIHTLGEGIERVSEKFSLLSERGYRMAQMGSTYRQRVDEDFRRAMAEKPDWESIYRSYGWALFHLGDFEAALSQWQKAADVEKEAGRAPSIDVLAGLSVGSWKTGAKEMAIVYYRRMVTIEPKFRDASHLNADILRWPEAELAPLRAVRAAAYGDR